MFTYSFALIYLEHIDVLEETVRKKLDFPYVTLPDVFFKVHSVEKDSFTVHIKVKMTDYRFAREAIVQQACAQGVALFLRVAQKRKKS